MMRKRIVSLLMAFVLVCTLVTPCILNGSLKSEAIETKWDVINTRGISGNDIVAQARTYLGVPYDTSGGNYQYRTGFGSTMMFDCSGFVYRVCRDVGLASSRQNYTQIPEGQDAYGNYYITAHTQEQRYYGTSLSNLVTHYKTSKDVSDFKPGDLLFFSYNGGSSTSHVGIYTSNGCVINATTSRGIVETPLSQNGWPNGTLGNSLFDAVRLITCEHSYNDIGICTNGCKAEYNWQSTFDTSCAGVYTVSLGDGIYLRTDKPYSASNYKSDFIKKGTEVEVLGSVTNHYPKTWYKVSYNETVGYTSVENLTFKAYGKQEISCTLLSPAEGAIVPKSAYPVIGTVTSKYPLQEVIALIDGEKYATVTLGNTTSLDIRPSDINYLLDFSSLAPGNHTLVIKARDIHHSDWVTVCTRYFITEGVVECEHSYTSQMTKSSTCLEDGIWTYTCSKCGSSYEEPIPATGYHCWGAWGITKESTCTQEGSREHRCAVCWELESETIPITDHQYGEWEIIVNVSCTASGLESRTCIACGDKQMLFTEPLGHDYMLEEVAGDCVTPTMYVYTCLVCGASYDEPTDQYGNHQYECNIVAPGCTTEGHTSYHCSVCGDSYRLNTTPPTGHKYEDDVCVNCCELDPDAVIKGDLDGDGEVTAADAVLLARYLADLIELDEKQLKAADVDDDGEITSADSVILARFLAGLIEVLED